MLLSDQDIQALLDTQTISIDPLQPSQIQAASVDLTLGRQFLKIQDYRLAYLSSDKAPDYNQIQVETLIVAPHTFVLATTEESIRIPKNLAGILEGRSSTGRLGLFIQNAGLVSPGFVGKLTLELYNANNISIALKAGMKVCQLLFFQLSKPAISPYSGKYQGQTKTTGSRLHLESTDATKLQPDISWDKACVLVANDHAGLKFKQLVCQYLNEKKITCRDIGAQTNESVDYPDYGHKVARAISEGKIHQGILICGSGIGMATTANRHPDVRAAVCYSPQLAESARSHNDANLLVLAERFTDASNLPLILDSWFSTNFAGGRHKRRVENIENKHLKQT